MSSEGFSFYFAEALTAIISNNWIIHALPNPVDAVWMHFSYWNSCHVWFRHLLWYNRNARLPQEDLLVISSGNKPFAVIYERYCIYCTLMFFVWLNKFWAICIELNDFLVLVSHQKSVVLIVIKLDAWGHLGRLVIMNNFSSLRVPKIHRLIEASAHKL